MGQTLRARLTSGPRLAALDSPLEVSADLHTKPVSGMELVHRVGCGGGVDGRDLLDPCDDPCDDEAAAQGPAIECLGCRAPLSSSAGSALFLFLSSTPSAGPYTHEELNQCDGTYRLIANQYWFYFSMFDYTGLTNESHV